MAGQARLSPVIWKFCCFPPGFNDVYVLRQMLTAIYKNLFDKNLFERLLFALSEQIEDKSSISYDILNQCVKSQHWFCSATLDLVLVKQVIKPEMYLSSCYCCIFSRGCIELSLQFQANTKRKNLTGYTLIYDIRGLI